MKHESFIRYEIVLAAKSVKESDMESFIEDAELHLIEGESDGKSVEEILEAHRKNTQMNL